MNSMAKQFLVVAGAACLLLVAGIAIAHSFNHTPANALTGPGTVHSASSFTLSGTLTDTEGKCKTHVSIQAQVSTTSATSGFTNLGSPFFSSNSGNGAYSFTDAGLNKADTRWYRTVTTGFVQGDAHDQSSHICNNSTSNVVSVTRT